MTSQVNVWDIFTRLFHWLLVASIGFAWWTGEQGGDWMEWHARCGYAVLALVLFRILWGIWGSHFARFRQFIYSPLYTMRYGVSMLRKQDKHYLGHNPLGGWMVITLMLLCALQAGTGLFANDDIMMEGPLAHLIRYELSSDLTSLHKKLFDLMLIAVALHIAAVLFHQFLRSEPLITSMFTGKKPLIEDQQSELEQAQRIGNKSVLGVGLVALSALAIWALISFA